MVVLVKNEFYTDGDYATPQVHAYESMQTARDDMFDDIDNERQVLSEDNMEILIDEGIDGTKNNKYLGSFWEIRSHNEEDNCDCILLWDLDEVVCAKEINPQDNR